MDCGPKVACGRSLLQVSSGPSTLVYWRKRIAKSGRPDRAFDAVARVILRREKSALITDMSNSPLMNAESPKLAA
ncbi:MAG: hypothetical protein ACLQDY_25985 [Streptosporangiaceae bacterium]